TEQSLSVPQITENPEERTLTPNPTIGIGKRFETYVSPRTLSYANPPPPILSNNAKEPVTSTSIARSPLATTSNVFSPELLRPLPTPPRKRNQPNRSKIKSAMLSDTPTKAAIEASRKIKNVESVFQARKGRSLKKLRRLIRKVKLMVKRVKPKTMQKIIVFACVALRPLPIVNRKRSGFSASNAKAGPTKLASIRLP
ncbi:hypothetical protein JTB14_017948, partial [Gonioctena quinquepunctata]